MPVTQRSCQELTSRIDAADELDDDVHVISVDERRRVIGEKTRVETLTRAIRMGDGDTSELDLTSHPSGDIFPPRLNHSGHLESHDPTPQQGHTYRLD